MRRRRSDLGRTRVAAASVAAALALSGGGAGAQVNESGVQPLLLPLGARVVGVGGAAVAAQYGSESLLSNPAALGFATAREIALLHGQDIFATRDLLAVVVPSRVLGTFAVTGYLVNLGTTPTTDEFGNEVGTAYVRNVALTASYGSTIGRALAVGLTYRLLQNRFDCSGICSTPGDPTPTAQLRPTTSMVDVGAQYDFKGHAPLAIGAAVRYLGLRLQVRDRDQADPLPTQFAFGARYDVDALAKQVKDARLRLSAELVRGFGAGGADASAHVGAEATFRNLFALRGGWVQRRGQSGPSVGFGYQSKRVGLDVARQLTGFSVDAGNPPTFVALRYAF